MNILFVTKSSFGSKSATGQMLNNLFGGLTEIQILQYSLMPENDVSVQLIDNVYKMQDVRFSVFCRVESLCNKKLEDSGKVKGAWKIIKRVCDFLDGLMPPMIFQSEINEIRSFKPDIVYSLAADIKVLRICNRLSGKMNIPIVLHNMDDFYNMKYGKDGTLRKIANYYLQKAYKKAYSHSKMSLAIGPKMRDEYSATFGLPFEWVMNCVTDSLSLPIYQPKDKIELIIFSGGLHGGRAKTLAMIAKEIENMDMKMEIYTSPIEQRNYENLFSSYNNTHLFKYVERDKMFDNLSRADVLLHVESYYPRYTAYFRLSMSTKIPEYMSVCRPIMCVGPSDIATVDFIQERKIGLIVNDINQFGDSLRKMEKADFRVALVNNSKEVLTKEFFKSKMQKKILLTFEANM